VLGHSPGRDPGAAFVGDRDLNHVAGPVSLITDSLEQKPIFILRAGTQAGQQKQNENGQQWISTFHGDRIEARDFSAMGFST